MALGEGSADGADAEIDVEVVYAEPQRAIVKTYRLSRPARLEDALRSAAQDPDFAHVDVHHLAAGVFGTVAGSDHILTDGDRVELYRPLVADPKLARRERAKTFKSKPK